MSKSFSSLLILSVVLVIHYANSQIPGFGNCPKVKVQENFDVHRYLGVWYEVKKYPFIFTLGGKCITAEYGLNQNGTVSVFNKQLRNGREDTIIGSARLIKPGSGLLGVTFPNVPFQTEANYNILETDYENYAVVYSCNSFLSIVNGKVVWILTRSRNPPQSILDRTFEVLRTNGISTSYLATTDNTGCPDEISNGIDNFRY